MHLYQLFVTNFYCTHSTAKPGLDLGSVSCISWRAAAWLQTCTGLIRSTLDKAYKMFDAGAYLHQYKQFGLERQDFDCCFARCEETYAAYESV